MKKPNILLICVDEMRADHIGCAGNPIVKTPNLDSLAAKGTLFARAYCNNPICMPARATMFTGLLPRDHGLRVNGQNMRPDLPTLAGVLAEAGYRTHSAGKLHLSPWVPMVEPAEPENYPECLAYWQKGLIKSFPTPYFGFQSVDFVGGHTSFIYGEYMQWLIDQGGNPQELNKTPDDPCTAPLCYKMVLPTELHYNRFIADSTINLIKECAEMEQPFMAWCSFPDPHMPVAPPAPYCDMYNKNEMPLPIRDDEEIHSMPAYLQRIADRKLKYQGATTLEQIPDEQWQEMLALTYGMITHVDDEIGRILNALEQHGMTDNTLIVFTSDHGDMMGDHGFVWKGPYTYQGCIRIPLIVKAPHAGNEGAIHQALVSQIDLMPSILDYCAVPMPGSNWQETAKYTWGQERDLNLYPGKSWVPLLENSNSQIHDSVIIENDNPATGYNIRTIVTKTHRLTVYPGTTDGELFDLVNDPHELNNLWGQKEAEHLKHILMEKLLMEYCQQTPFYPVPPWNS